MVIINERNGKFLNYFTPLMVIGIGGILLESISLICTLIIVLIGPAFPLDLVITNLLVLLISQIIGIFIVYFVFIPLFKAKKVQYHKPTILNAIRTIVLICGTFSAIVIINLLLVYIIGIFNLNPQSGYSDILLTPGHLANPLNILIYYLPLTVGAPIYEELVYRRLLIPLLENRGMKPLTAITSSSLLFAIAHLPADLLNGNLSGGVIHITAVFLIGFSLGLIYILTRNVLYPIIIHGVLNFISFSGPLIIIAGNSTLALSYSITYWTIFIAGLGVLFYGLWQFFKKQTVEWVVIVRKKNPKNSLLGLFGFKSMGIIIIIIPVILELTFVGLGIAAYNIILYLIVIIISLSAILILYSWLGTRTRYESDVNLI
ncbi:MAG: type II CAAX endopeptidase family protein [Candidatus Lokiarchaeia archaeon]|nr:type II CAAX endopeptidase family protein [Candidatus Lokiarchaeia archaeon]